MTREEAELAQRQSLKWLYNEVSKKGDYTVVMLDYCFQKRFRSRARLERWLGYELTPTGNTLLVVDARPGVDHAV